MPHPSRIWLASAALWLGACKSSADAMPAPSDIVVTSAATSAPVGPAPIPYVAFHKDSVKVGCLVPLGDPDTHGAQNPVWLYSAYSMRGWSTYTRDAARFSYDEVAAQRAALQRKGFTETPTPAPADLQLENHLAARPPSLVLVRGPVRASVAVDPMPDVARFGAEIVGLSPDGKNVALHLGRTPGSPAQTDGLHVVLVAPLP